MKRLTMRCRNCGETEPDAQEGRYVRCAECGTWQRAELRQIERERPMTEWGATRQ